MEKTTEDKPPSRWRGIAQFILDIWLGAAAISAVSYLLFLWSADFFSLPSFWGSEPNPFGQYLNILKTAACLSLIIALFSFGSDAEISRLSHSFLFGYAFVGSQTGPPVNNNEVRKVRILTGAIGGSLITLLIAFLFLPLLSSANLLPNKLSLNAEPIHLTLQIGKLLRHGESIESTIDENMFAIEMEKGIEYFIILEQVNNESGNFSLSFSFPLL